jgi:HEAT repeat protein
MVEETHAAGATPGLPGSPFLKSLEDLLIALRRSSKDLAFYPAEHPLLTRSLEQAVSQLHAAVSARAPLMFTVTRSGFSCDGQPIGSENRQLAAMAAELFVRRIQKIFFAPDVETEELAGFLRVITGDPKQLIQQGGPGKVLATHKVGRIQVNEFDFRHVSQAPAPGGRATASATKTGPGAPAGPVLPTDPAAVAAATSTPVTQPEPRPKEPEALVAAQAAQKEQTVASLLQRLEREAASGMLPGYEWAASRLEKAAAQGIRDDAQDDVLTILRALLQHQQNDALKTSIRDRAARAVDKVAPGSMVAQLVERLGSAAEESVGGLSAILLGLGPRAIAPLLTRMAAEDQPSQRTRLVDTLARFVEVAGPDLTQALLGTDRDSASRMAPILGEAGGEGSLALLTCLAQHPDARVRRDVVRSLGRIGGGPTHRLLLQALRDPDSAVLEAAIGIVGQAKVKLATPTLLRLAGERVWAGKAFAVRKAAVAALGAMGEAGSISALARLLRTRTWFRRPAGDELRQAAALALLAIGRTEAREVVEAGERSRRRDVRRACRAALQKVTAVAPAQE